VIVVLLVVAVGAWAGEQQLQFSKMQKMPTQQTQQIIQSAGQVVGDQTEQLDPEQGYQACDVKGKPYAYFILNKQQPTQQDGGCLGLMSLQTTKNPQKMSWMWGEQGGGKVQFQKLQPKGSKSVGVGYGEEWSQGQNYQQGQYYDQCQQQQQQQQCPVQLGWQTQGKGKGKFGKGKPGGQQQQGQWDQSQSGCIQIQGQQQQESWTFKCPPPPKWGKFGKDGGFDKGKFKPGGMD
jgi:hypothetical protein